MPTSLAEALANTGDIPPVDASQLVDPTIKKEKHPAPPDGSTMAKYVEDDSKIQVARNERDSAAADTPKFPTLAPEPQPDHANDPIQGYVSAIGVLGALGSMFTRRPMTNAMNASAAALNSIKSGDEEDYKKKFETWKEQNDNAFKLLDYQTKIYDSILKNKSSSVDERIAEMQAHAAMFKDDYMMQLAKDRQLDSMVEHNVKMQEAAQKGVVASQKVEEGNEKREIYQQWRKENPNAKAEEIGAARARIFDPSVAAAEVRSSATEKKAIDKAQESANEAISDIDDLIAMVDKGGGMGVTGLAGMGQRVAEVVGTAVPVGKDVATPANDFQSKIETMKLELPKKLTGTSKSAIDERKEVANIIGGLGAGQTKDITKNKLRQLRGIFERRAKRTEPYDTQNYKIGDTVFTPTGTRKKITGFDTDGTPLGVDVDEQGNLVDPSEEEH